MNAAARVVSDTLKYDRGLTYLLLHDERHWQDVPERGAVQAVLNGSPMSAAQGITVHERLCIHTSDIARRQHLRSAG